MLEHELIQLLRQKFAKVIEVVDEDFGTVRVGRAKPDMVEGVSVPAYGSRMRLVEVATIAAPDTNMLIVTPFDRSLMGAIEKAISDSELQLSPAVSGDIIRIVVPSLTQERRLDFVKLLKQKTESGKVMLRQARQDVKDKIDVLKEMKTVSEDDIFMLLADLDKITGEFNEKIEAMCRAKEDEIMAV
ncbi:MAG: Ribosome-recycling factor [Candidatus Collierbacteria bacterium GW2011_GWC2_44_18]|uniref:Ribosome-recycling factor n=2 Tax=Microgenomates group TaxID=1794810 RepID=A0A0G1J3U0_9BACT|nr:MAG: ribosome recycling factor [Microgenomates group bacterium GW2011_GWC1_44_10]KKT48868.1 MAG: Ribosome-recycling factor [Candidatus Collierbacteria bacterium GW2011_GWC2_44_18]KKT66291.1 MAG: Ribosome-recycling factor [Candidatus Woesebacteria bacterium GW2011_GWA2_44_33]